VGLRAGLDRVTERNMSDLFLLNGIPYMTMQREGCGVTDLCLR